MPTAYQLSYLEKCYREPREINLEGAALLQDKIDSGEAVLFNDGPAVVSLVEPSELARDNISGHIQAEYLSEEYARERDQLAREYQQENASEAVKIPSYLDKSFVYIGAVLLSFNVKIDSSSIDIRDGVYVCPDSCISGHHIGEDTWIGRGVTIEGAEIGKSNVIHSGAKLDTVVTTEDNVSIGAYTVIGFGVTIDEGSVIGHNVRIDDNAGIGKNAVIGNGSYILGDAFVSDNEQLPPGSIRLPKGSEDRVTFSEYDEDGFINRSLD